MITEQNPLPFGLHESDKFVLIAMGIALGPERDQPLASGLRLYREFPDAVLKDYWKRWLGEIGVDRLKQCNTIVVASASSQKPEILDAEHSALASRVSQFLFPLALMRTKFFESPHVLQGSVVNGEVDIRRQGTFHPHSWFEDFPINPLSVKEVEAADHLLRVLQTIFENKSHRRLARGLKSLSRAFGEHDALERMHLVVRAFDGLVMTEQGRGTAQFRDRCQLFTGESENSKEFFEKLYLRRSEVEHLTELSDLTVSEDVFDSVAKELDQQHLEAEVLVIEAYRRVLERTVLLEHFETDGSIRDFWNLPLASRQALFGNAINVQNVKRASKERCYHHMGREPRFAG